MPNNPQSENTEVKVILARLEGKLDAHARQLQDHVTTEAGWQEQTADTLHGLDDQIRGNGVRPGLTIRLDRVEQREKGRAKFLWIAVSTGVAALAAWVSSLFNRS